MYRENYLVLITKTAATLLAQTEGFLETPNLREDSQIERAVELAGRIVDAAVQRTCEEFAVEGKENVSLTEKIF
jgi:hypothetical protein